MFDFLELVRDSCRKKIICMSQSNKCAIYEYIIWPNGTIITSMSIASTILIQNKIKNNLGQKQFLFIFFDIFSDPTRVTTEIWKRDNIQIAILHS